MGNMQRHDRQQGAVLAATLVILLLLTLIGVGAMGGASLEQKMAANSSQREENFQATELCLLAAQAWMEEKTIRPVEGTCEGNEGACSVEVWAANALAANWWEQNDPAWWNSYGITVDEAWLTEKQLPLSLANSCRFIVELRSYVPDSILQEKQIK
ncbi:MAG TPA: hypothetical protein ENJ43_01540, partial [Gammaproteobacteria bacterium]|nr:hypothetical protein [Gammaproteobacteria bacterium]